MISIILRFSRSFITKKNSWNSFKMKKKSLKEANVILVVETVNFVIVSGMEENLRRAL